MDKDEWFKQADYDMETADFMFKGERYFYARVSILTRYPDNLQRMLNEYSMNKTKEILEKDMELLEWLKTK